MHPPPKSHEPKLTAKRKGPNLEVNPALGEPRDRLQLYQKLLHNLIQLLWRSWLLRVGQEPIRQQRLLDLAKDVRWIQ